MHAVHSRVKLNGPLSEEQLAAAQVELDAQAAEVDGLVAIHAMQTDGGELVLLVLGEDAAALERTREQLGDAFMRKHVAPHAAGAPEREITKVVLSYQRGG